VCLSRQVTSLCPESAVERWKHPKEPIQIPNNYFGERSSTRTYWYAWKGGPRLRGEPGTPEFMASYNDAVARKVAPPRGVLLGVMQQYQASEDFRLLADSTRRSYVPLIARIEKRFGDFPLPALDDKRTRGVFMAWRDQLAANPGADKRTMRGRFWPVFCRGASIAVWSIPIHASAAGGCIADRGWTIYGPTPTRPHS
jgi:hypothetical protein